MKKISLLIIVILGLNLTAGAQNFEGKIVYQNNFKSKIPSVTDDQLNGMMGNKQEFFIKGGDYKSVTNGQMVQWQMYLSKDNKLYSKTSMAPTIYWNDATENKDEVIKAEVNKDVTDVAGYKCNELVLTTKSGVQKFYFNEKISADPELFKNHKFGNWYDVISKTKSIPLKMVIESPQFNLENVAIEVVPEKVDANMFALPEGATFEKNPYIN